MLTLGLPRRMGSTTAALQLANFRGKFIYFAPSGMAYYNRDRFPQYAENGVWVPWFPGVQHGKARGHKDVRTVVFDCIHLCPEDWSQELAKFASKDLLVLRVG